MKAKAKSYLPKEIRKKKSREEMRNVGAMTVSEPFSTELEQGGGHGLGRIESTVKYILPSFL